MALNKRYYSLDGTLIGQEEVGGQRTDYACDALGSVTATLVGGAIQNQYAYKPYGALLAGTGGAADPAFAWVGTLGYRSTGRPQAGTYVRARHFNALAQRWISNDPLWPSELRYTYAGGNPVSFVDPTGLRIRKNEPVPLDCLGADVDFCKTKCSNEGLDYESCARDEVDGGYIIDCGCKPKPCPNPIISGEDAFRQGIKILNSKYVKCSRIKTGPVVPAATCPGGPGYGTHQTNIYKCGKTTVSMSVRCCPCLKPDGDEVSTCKPNVHR